MASRPSPIVARKTSDLRFFNAATPGLVAPQYLQGYEDVSIENSTPGGQLQFQLPGIRPPKICVQLRGGKDVHVESQLDTVIINTDEMLLFLLWRSCISLRSGPHDVVTIDVGCQEGQRLATSE